MKKFALIAMIAIGCSSAFYTSQAQIRVNVGINIGSQPDWGPVGYDHADYYYMPDINTYYSVTNHQYISYQNNAWIRTTALPPVYRNYDLYHGYKVVVNDRDPWLRNDVYRTRYATYKGRRDQVVIRDSQDEKYRNHWDNGKHKGWDKQEDKQQRKEWKQKGDDKHENNGDDHGHGNRGHGKGHDD
jgi:hypothetical protein